MGWTSQIKGGRFVPRARRTDPPSSHAAVEAVDLTTVRGRVLALFGPDDVLSQFEVIDRYRSQFGHVAESTVRTREVAQRRAREWIRA